MLTEDRKMLSELNDRLKLLAGIVGPIVPAALPNLDGWTWKFEQTSERLILTRGRGPVALIPTIQAAQTGDRGWGTNLAVFFSDPDTELFFSVDSWTFRMSPRQMSILSPVGTPNNMSIYVSVYNPATLLGPLYGLMWNPSQLWPYNTSITFQAQHPRTALTPTSQVVLAVLGRNVIRDRKQFYESIFVEARRQACGRVEVDRRGI